MNKLNFPFKSTSKVNLGLHSAAASGNIGLVKFALDNGQPIDSVLNGLLPIHIAACHGQLHIVKYLIEKGCDVNGRRKPRRYSGSLSLSRNKQEVGCTALHYAVANGNLEMIKLLLENGALVHVLDKYGSTPLSIALARGDVPATMLMTEYLVKQEPLLYKMLKKDVKSELCLDINDVNIRRKSLSDLKDKSYNLVNYDTTSIVTIAKSSPLVSFLNQASKPNLLKI